MREECLHKMQHLAALPSSCTTTAGRNHGTSEQGGLKQPTIFDDLVTPVAPTADLGREEGSSCCC